MDSGAARACQVKNSTLGEAFFADSPGRRTVSNALTTLWCGPYLSPAAELHACWASIAPIAAVCCMRILSHAMILTATRRGQVPRTAMPLPPGTSPEFREHFECFRRSADSRRRFSVHRTSAASGGTTPASTRSTPWRTMSPD